MQTPTPICVLAFAQDKLYAGAVRTAPAALGKIKRPRRRIEMPSTKARVIWFLNRPSQEMKPLTGRFVARSLVAVQAIMNYAVKSPPGQA